MNGKTLLETYPKAAKVIKQHFVNQLVKSLETADLPEDFKEFARQQEIDNDKIGTLIDSQPRGLFDVFDDNELHVEILVMYSDRPSIFTYTVIEGDLIHTQPTKYTSRIEAERVAIEKAFEILNDKL